MKNQKLSTRNRTLPGWAGCIAAGLLTVALAGCGGSSSDAPAAAPAAGGGAVTPATAAANIATATALAANDTATTPTAAFSVVQAAGVPAVTINSPPKVNFTVISDGAVVKDLPPGNARFIIAKLVPGTNGAPDQWASYINRTETATATVGPSGAPVLASAVQATTETATADTLVYNDAGYYTYTFTTDIKDTAQTNGLAFDASATHRVAIQLSYTNKAGATVLVNPYFDFTVDANGNAVEVTDTAKTRKVVDIASCNECHSALALHGGGRVDTQYCVLCHNSGTTDANSGNVLDLRIMAHKIHNGEHAKEYFGYDYAIWGFRDSKHDYAEVTYPQPLANCTKCHDGAKTPQGDNWKTKPSRAACGACHTGIDFATGKGVTMEDGHKAAAADAVTAGSGTAIRTASIGHIGGSKADDSQCVLCHGEADIPVYHVTVDPTGSEGRGGYPVNTATDVPTAGYPRGQGPGIPLAAQMNLPAGVYKLDYEIKQVTVAGAAGAKKATVVYRILLDGAPLKLNATGKLKDDLDGSPGVYVAWGHTQDGIAKPADWNTYGNSSVTALRDGTDGSQTGPDAEGYYTATLPDIIPDAATHVTAAIGVDYQGFVQSGLTAYPKGIRLREPKFVMKVADGYDARRPIVSADKCNACHAQLGVAPSFHSGARNNGEGCAICHDANRATSHGGSWNVGVKNLVHGIHGGSKRAQDFSYEATATNTKGFGKVTYPGVLKNCEQCHVEGSYDFSGTANKAALPNLLWTTDANGDERAAADLGLSPWLTALATGKDDYRTDNLVTSPITSACFGCHDSTTAVTHMQSNGGSIYAKFSSVASVATRPAEGTASTMTFTKAEQCMTCHSSSSTYGLGIKAVHAK
ncbi:MAG: OmcA/MtrC family decaheme c-type cytochrome [Burkholderiales bacterium]|nr:OmcA/MtrC family decaheme c-type cytochrome [Burkholderiales bacterium]